MTLDLGILLALACAFVANLGFFYKHRGANSVPKIDVRHPFAAARSLYSSKWFTIGMITATISWGLHVAALAMAPMSVIQVALAAGVVFIAVMADKLFGFEVGRRQWIGLSLMAAGLAVLGITAPTMHGAHSQFSVAAMIAFEAGLFGLGGLLIMGPRMGGPVEHHGVMLGAAAGILFGVSDTAIKALTGITGAHGFLGLLLSPWLIVAVLASIVAFYASARGLQDGDAVPVIAVTGTAANIAGITGGILVFGDPMAGSPLGLTLQDGDAVPVIAVTGTAANIAGITGGILVFGDPMAGSPLGITLQAIAFVAVIVAAAMMPAPVRAAGAAASA